MDFTSSVETACSEVKQKQPLIEYLQNKKLYWKFIILRKYCNPHSVVPEKVIQEDLQIGPPLNKKSHLNFNQIRPDHSIDYYIFCYHNLGEGNIGWAFIFKIPSEDVYKLTLQFGGYTHVTFLRLGKIAENNLKNRNCEFSLRPNPNAKKNFQILQIMGCTLTIRGWIPSRKSLTNTQLFWVSHYFWWGATISLDPLLTKMGRPLPHLLWSGLLWTSGSCWLILTGKRRVWGQTQEPLLCGSSDRFYFATQISKFTSHYTACVQISNRVQLPGLHHGRAKNHSLRGGLLFALCLCGVNDFTLV